MKTKNYEVSQRQRVKSILFVSIITILSCSNVSMASPVIYEKNPSCKIYRVMARAYMAYGEFNKAMPLAEKSLAIVLQQKSIRRRAVANCLRDLAFIYKNLDRFSERRTILQARNFLQKQIYYDRHPYVAYSLRTLSVIYQGQGKIRTG